jgi:hypothetical protein
MEIKQEDIIMCQDLESLDYAYNKFKDICDKFKKIREDKFEYSLNIDYDKLELTISMVFNDPEIDENDYTEGSSQLN